MFSPPREKKANGFPWKSHFGLLTEPVDNVMKGAKLKKIILCGWMAAYLLWGMKPALYGGTITTGFVGNQFFWFNQQENTTIGSIGDCPFYAFENGNGFTAGSIGNQPFWFNQVGNVGVGSIGNEPIFEYQLQFPQPNSVGSQGEFAPATPGLDFEDGD